MASRSRSKKPTWSKTTELVSLEFVLRAETDCDLYAQYTIALHAWFLQQIQSFDPELSAYLHDGESEKPFAITGLNGAFVAHSRTLRLDRNQLYRWRVTGLSAAAVAGLAAWLKQPPTEMVLKDTPLVIQAIELALPATTYQGLKQSAADAPSSLDLTFASPTSFRRRGHHLPLPWPRNVFHSYLRRWNHFSGQAVPQDDFLDWVDDHVIIQRHQLQSVKVAAGKRGSVTGFTGAVTYGLDRKAQAHGEFYPLFFALGRLAPYCGTGHKTTFGLGETVAGWQLDDTPVAVPSAQALLAERIDELTALFRAQRKRTGGDRAQNIAENWATVVARRELGDSLQDIAADLGIPYETAKTYGKLARRALREQAEG
jgi:CRISPR-associated endoribonuclease Cas6